MRMMTRKSLNKSTALAVGATALPALGAGPTRNLKIGSSTLTWGVSP